MSALLNLDTAREALDIAAPALEAARLNQALGQSGFIHVVVMDPARSASSYAFDEAILLERSFGDPAQWDARYDLFARAKARLAWRYGLDASRVQAQLPHLLQPGDTLLSGAVCVDGIVVALSGLESWYDEAFATCVASLLRAGALSRHRELGTRTHTLPAAEADAAKLTSL